MGHLYRLVFTSRPSMGDEDGLTAGMAAVIGTSRRNNAAVGLTSGIVLHDGRITQVMEGPMPAVDSVFDRIRADPRHREVVLIHRESVEDRAFPGETMVLVGRSPQGRRTLDRLALDGGGTLAAARPQAIVDTMRAVAESEAALPAGADAGGDLSDPERAAAARAHPADAQSLQPSCEPEAGFDAPEWNAVDAVIAMALFTAEKVAVRANENYCGLLGYAPSAFPGLPYETFVAPGDLDRLERLWSAMGRGETVTLHHRSLRKDGAEVWLESVFRPRLDPDGRLVDVVEIAADHTEKQRQRADDRGQIQAINAAQLVLHLELDGTVQDANPLFLDAMGYSIEDIRGRHHRMFVPDDYADSEDYASFWADLAAGRHRTGEYRRIGNGDRPVWLQATYNPICDMGGRPFKIVTYASVVTDAKLRQSDYESQIAAIHKSHAVITFDLNGVILDVNEVFLDAVGYRRAEIVGRHHRMFVEPSYAHGAEYATFWRNLRRGQHQAGQYKRHGKGGREVWLQATYNPVVDMDGQAVKVVKYATVVTDERLRQAEHQGQIAAIHKGQCVISFDLDGTILDANDNYLDVMGYKLAEVRGRHHAMFVDAVEREGRAYQVFWPELAAGLHKTGEFKRVGRDGREIWLQATYHPILDMNGRPFRVVKYASDVTAEKLRRADFEGQIQAIRRSQGVVTLGLDGTILDVNETMLGILGYGLGELRDRHHSVLVDPSLRDSQDYAVFWSQLREGRFASGLYKRLGKGGREIWIQATYNPILDLSGRPVKIIKFASDVTSDVALAEAFEDAKRQAQHDSATALPNRSRLASFLSSALGEPDARLVVLYIDLDHFKSINDAFGHDVGDRVLGEVADRLRRLLSPDQLVARVGGDEFVVAAPDLKDEEIEHFCQTLMTATGAPIRHEAGDLTVTLSIGIAVAPADGRAPDDLLRCADAALARSKQAGRGTYSLYSASMADRILSYRRTVDDLRRAIAADEFFLEYQPRFEARSHRVRSFEALIRWQHPKRGRINPADFIPVAEKSGLITQIGAWVLRTACRDAATWGGVGVSVNVSPIQFRTGNLPALIGGILAETGLRADRLELEITEGVLLENADIARAALGDLKALGLKLAMDDFGTGYSSLSTLRDYPFDVIKIDKQFVSDLDGRQGGREVVQAILALSRALGLSVTAEGVETEQQLEALTVDDCDEVQGFLLGRPMAARDVTPLLEAIAIGHLARFAS